MKIVIVIVVIILIVGRLAVDPHSKDEQVPQGTLASFKFCLAS